MTALEHSPQVWKYGLENAHRIIDEFWVDVPPILVSEYAETHRILPGQTPFPGPWRNDKTPYLVEPMDSMSAYSPIQREIIVKGAQLGFTASAENITAYWMDVSPTEILFISATEDLLGRWATKRLEPLIESCGLRKKIFAQNAARGSKRTGDRAFSKEFIGGSLDMASAQSAASLRAVDKRLLLRDEIDGAPIYLRTGEGNWLKVSYVRTNAWGIRRKVYDFSTPTTYADSAIWPEYEMGDRRRYYVPCPHCGEMQILEWGHGFGTDNPNLGMQWEIIDGRVSEAWYICEKCEKKIFNHHKGEMLKKGQWRPTAKSYSEFVISRQLSSLYSPVGMLTWKEMVVEYLDAQNRSDGMRSFVNLYLGLPYRETGARPDWQNVIELRGNYRAGTVPDGVIFLTLAVDVQRGSEKKEKNNPARLEMEVCGHGIGYRTWSIEHRVFEGEIDDPNTGAWAKLAEYWQETGMAYLRHDGARFVIQKGLVDSGDGPHTGCVYAFTSGWKGIYPSKGMPSVKRRRGEPLDEDMNRSIRRYRIAAIDSGKTLVEINTPFYKRQIYTNLKIPRKPGDIQQANFCDFPIDYGQGYFEQLTAEEMVFDREGTVTFHKSSARPNEALDLRVMNLCARDAFLEDLVLAMRGDAKARGYQPASIALINSKVALDWLSAAATPKQKN